MEGDQVRGGFHGVRWNEGYDNVTLSDAESLWGCSFEEAADHTPVEIAWTNVDAMSDYFPAKTSPTSIKSHSPEGIDHGEFEVVDTATTWSIAEPPRSNLIRQPSTPVRQTSGESTSTADGDGAEPFKGLEEVGTHLPGGAIANTSPQHVRPEEWQQPSFVLQLRDVTADLHLHGGKDWPEYTSSASSEVTEAALGTMDLEPSPGLDLPMGSPGRDQHTRADSAEPDVLGVWGAVHVPLRARSRDHVHVSINQGGASLRMWPQKIGKIWQRKSLFRPPVGAWAGAGFEPAMDLQMWLGALEVVDKIQESPLNIVLCRTWDIAGYTSQDAPSPRTLWSRAALVRESTAIVTSLGQATGGALGGEMDVRLSLAPLFVNLGLEFVRFCVDWSQVAQGKATTQQQLPLPANHGGAASGTSVEEETKGADGTTEADNVVDVAPAATPSTPSSLGDDQSTVESLEDSDRESVDSFEDWENVNLIEEPLCGRVSGKSKASVTFEDRNGLTRMIPASSGATASVRLINDTIEAAAEVWEARVLRAPPTPIAVQRFEVRAM